MTPFRSTVRWSMSTAAALYIGLTVAGYFFLSGHKNELAQTILWDHTGMVVWLYFRILVGYLIAGFLAATLLHPIPFLRGPKAALGTLALAGLGFLYTLTADTHLLYGPVHGFFTSARDLMPSFVRNAYHPAYVLVLFGLLALSALLWWSRSVAWQLKIVTLVAVGMLFLLPRLGSASADGYEGPPSLLLIATDSLRADHLSCNGYGRKTTPHIDALAARGTNFTNCLVPTASTHESWVSLLSSTHPRTNGLRHMFPSKRQVRELERNLTFYPQLLQDKGYRTAVIGGWCGTTFSLIDCGFEEVDVSNALNHSGLLAEAAFTNHLLADFFMDNPAGRLLVPELNRVSFTRGASSLTRKTKRALDRFAHDGRPFCLVVVYHVTHLPYSASYPYYSRFVDPEYRGKNRYRIDFEIDAMIQRGFEHGLSEEERRHIIDLYDGCVQEFDDQVGAIVAHLRELGLDEHTVVGVFADHGDDLYEHGTTLGHGVTLFGGDQANHVPAVFAGPGVPKRREDKLVRSFDLTPTLATWMGIESPEGWEGEDLSGPVPDLTALLETSYLMYRQPLPDPLPGERAQEFPTLDKATDFDASFDHNMVLKEEVWPQVLKTKCYAVRKGNYKLIYVPGEKGPIYRLYDLSQDPQCERDLAREGHAELQRLKALLPPEASAGGGEPE